MLSVALVLITLITALLFLYLERRPKGYPKGPWGLPVLGNGPLLGIYPYETLAKLSKKFGPIIGLYLGNTRVVILHTPEIIKEALKQDVFAGRPGTPYILKNWDERLGVMATQGEDWVEQRRFVFHQLKDLGFGKRGCEGIIADEIAYMVEKLRKSSDKPVDDLGRMFISATTNVMMELTFGHRIDQNDQTFLDWLIKCQKFFGDPTILLVYNYMPWIWKWLPTFCHSKYNTLVNELKAFAKKEVQTHRENYEPNEMRDLIDTYIRQIKATTDPASSFYEQKGWNSLTSVVEDLLLTSLDTTAVSLTWLFAHLCHNPEVQEKCRKEIEREVGLDRMPGFEDKIKLPFCEATINESLRFSSISPLASFRSVRETTEFMGYVFPKDTHILANVWHANIDENIWEHPQEFRPERFLTADGKFKMNSNMLSFSTGKRVCPGESLARQQMFLFTVALLQNFSFTYLPGEGPPTAAQGISVVRHVEPYKVRVTPLTKH